MLTKANIWCVDWGYQFLQSDSTDVTFNILIAQWQCASLVRLCDHLAGENIITKNIYSTWSFACPMVYKWMVQCTNITLLKPRWQIINKHNYWLNRLPLLVIITEKVISRSRTVLDEFDERGGIMYRIYLMENNQAHNGKQLGADTSWKNVLWHHSN